MSEEKPLETAIKKRKLQKKLKRPVMTVDQRRHILNTLIKSNCNFRQDEYTHPTSELKVPLNEIQEFVNGIAAKVEERTNRTGNEEMEAANRMLNHLDKLNCKFNSKYEIPLALKTITDIERHPDMDDIEGIDLKSIYQTLTNLAMGFPAHELDLNSKKFLKSVYLDLLNTVSNDIETKDMSELQKILNTPITTSRTSASSAETEQSEKLKWKFERLIGKIEKNTELNPLNVPLDVGANLNKKQS